MLSRFHLIPERHGQTERQTDGRMDGIAIFISRVSVLTDDNKIHTPCKATYAIISHIRAKCLGMSFAVTHSNYKT